MLSIRFANEKTSNLGVPLPSGSVRVYEKDGGGQERYIGAASIGDTPKRERVSLTLSKVFDVYAGYKVLDSKRISKHIVRKTVEAQLHNEKATPMELRVVESFETRWTPVTESLKSEKLDTELISGRSR